MRRSAGPISRDAFLDPALRRGQESDAGTGGADVGDVSRDAGRGERRGESPFGGEQAHQHGRIGFTCRQRRTAAHQGKIRRRQQEKWLLPTTRVISAFAVGILEIPIC